jgi:hypothetical protein
MLPLAVTLVQTLDLMNDGMPFQDCFFPRHYYDLSSFHMTPAYLHTVHSADYMFINE